jgi:hypothetical protein
MNDYQNLAIRKDKCQQPVDTLVIQNCFGDIHSSELILLYTYSPVTPASRNARIRSGGQAELQQAAMPEKLQGYMYL